MISVSLLVNLLGSACTVVVVAYVVTRTRIYEEITEDRIGWKTKIFLSVLFGLFSIYGTLSGVKIMDAIANTRDVGPAIAGLVAGPLVGLAAGLIGAVHRYFQGGFTAVSCSLSTVLAGLLSGFFYLLRKRKFPSVPVAMAVMVGLELLHMGVTLLIAHPLDKALALVKGIVAPMIVANGFGMGIFAYMMHNLKWERAMQAERRTMEGELKAARDIQMNILPKIFPPFPERPEFDLFATIAPAKEVGGDFYDFFLKDDHRLYFVIGDASGKGVPASLFMAVTKTLIKATAGDAVLPGDVLTKVNDELSKDNDSAMFATVFCGLLDTLTGDILYANGGHNPPVLVGSNGSVRLVPRTGGIMVGAMEGSWYGTKKIRLAPGESVLLFTDGVTEAMNHRKDLFTDKRLAEMAGNLAFRPVREGVEDVMGEVVSFAGGEKQSDDITIMLLRFKGNNHDGNGPNAQAADSRS